MLLCQDPVVLASRIRFQTPTRAASPPVLASGPAQMVRPPQAPGTDEAQMNGRWGPEPGRGTEAPQCLRGMEWGAAGRAAQPATVTVSQARERPFSVLSLRQRGGQIPPGGRPSLVTVTADGAGAEPRPRASCLVNCWAGGRGCTTGRSWTRCVVIPPGPLLSAATLLTVKETRAGKGYITRQNPTDGTV